MFKKSEESEWTRFSRALGGNQQAPAEEQAPANESDEPVTLSNTAPPAETETYLPPAPEPEPEPRQAETEEPLMPTYAASTMPSMSASLSRLPDLERGETVVGDTANIEGSIRTERSVRVRGAVSGEIESGGRVVVEEQAKVKARISAEHVTVLGEVDGSIECTGRVEIAASGRVSGEVSAGTLVIQEGAFFEGHLRMTSGQPAGMAPAAAMASEE